MASVDVTGVSANTFVSGNYLSAYDTGSYSLSAPLAVEMVRFGTTVLSSNITIQGVHNTDIVFSEAGIYNIIFSIQVTCNTPQAHLFYLWLCKNGATVADTNSVLTIHGTHGGNNGHSIAAWNFIVNVLPGESYQLCWSGDDQAIRIETIASPGGTIPVSPSAILSVSQV